VRVERVEGMAPVSWLRANEKEVIFDRPPISEGTEPVKRLEFRYRNDNFVSDPR
jgi:hypothetical protein